ncbi:YfiR family protein [Azonexus sp.]|uniref:YfiR family protein n=1 Tax=Azonexus sp. TaxID=1872668 RepID=UPI0027B9BACD|nr:YfiR family protein [Azonexus sp.]
MLLLMVGLLSLLQAPWVYAGDEERKLEAVFIGRFASYIDWPDKDRERERFVITLLDDNPFGKLLDDLYRDKRIHNKPIELRYANKLEQVGETDVLFITLRNAAARLAATEFAHKNGILTISEAKGFAESGGIIQLDFVEQKTRIKINHAAAVKSGLKIGAPLLSIATVLRGDKP